MWQERREKMSKGLLEKEHVTHTYGRYEKSEKDYLELTQLCRRENLTPKQARERYRPGQHASNKAIKRDTRVVKVRRASAPPHHLQVRHPKVLLSAPRTRRRGLASRPAQLTSPTTLARIGRLRLGLPRRRAWS